MTRQKTGREARAPRRWRWLALAAVLLASSAPGLALAQADANLQAVWAREPQVGNTVKAALRNFKVHPEALDQLRSNARTRALLPILAAGYRLDNTDFARTLNQTISMPTNINENTLTRTNSVTLGGVWDLRELAFNPSEVQVYGIVGIQRDLILEVTRTYFLRRQLMTRLAMRPPTDPLAKATLDLRVDEYTAILDALTGGWFTKAGRNGGNSEP
jgi:hypothetical protein